MENIPFTVKNTTINLGRIEQVIAQPILKEPIVDNAFDDFLSSFIGDHAIVIHEGLFSDQNSDAFLYASL